MLRRGRGGTRPRPSSPKTSLGYGLRARNSSTASRHGTCHHQRRERRLGSRRRRGAALVLAIGVLAIVALFAITFASLMQLERQASSNYVLSLRAELLARAGVAHGV